MTALITGTSLINGLIYLLVIGIVLWLLVWLVGRSPLPDPFKTVITFVLYAVGVILLINWLLGLVGHGFIAV